MIYNLVLIEKNKDRRTKEVANWHNNNKTIYAIPCEPQNTQDTIRTNLQAQILAQTRYRFQFQFLTNFNL